MSYATNFFGPWFGYFEHAMSGLSLEQKAIANNIANANNPNYHPEKVDFQSQLKGLLAESSLGGGGGNQSFQVHLTGFSPEFQSMIPNSSSNPRIEVEENKKVNLNQQMADLAKVQIMYDIAAKSFTPKWEQIPIQGLTGGPA